MEDSNDWETFGSCCQLNGSIADLEQSDMSYTFKSVYYEKITITLTKKMKESLFKLTINYGSGDYKKKPEQDKIKIFSKIIEEFMLHCNTWNVLTEEERSIIIPYLSFFCNVTKTIDNNNSNKLYNVSKNYFHTISIDYTEKQVDKVIEKLYKEFGI